MLGQAGPARWRLLGKLCLAACIGIALSAPQILPFLQYLHLGTNGGHASLFAKSIAPRSIAPLQMFPLAFGAIGEQPPAALQPLFDGQWGRVGGWFGCLPFFLAVFALIAPSRKHSAVRILLVCWVVVWQARYFGPVWLIDVFNLVPGLPWTDAVRYGGVTVMFALFTLAAVGLDALRDHSFGWNDYALAAAILLFSACLSVLPAWHLMALWFKELPSLRLPALAIMMLALGGALVLGALLLKGRARRVAVVWMIGGAIVTFALPQLAAPRGGHMEGDGVAFLAANAGLSRIYGIGPDAGNFLAPQHIAALDFVQLPAPRLWVEYIRNHLDEDADPQVFAGNPGSVQALLANLPSYSALGVKYITTAPGIAPFSVTMPAAFGRAAGVLDNLIRPVTLRPGDSFGGVFADTGRWPAVDITGTSFPARAMAGHESGSLAAMLCQLHNECTFGSVSLTGLSAQGVVTIKFPHPFAFIGGQRLTYIITYYGKDSATLWLTHDSVPSHASALVPAGATTITYLPGVALPVRLQTIPVQTMQPPALVRQGADMNIYELPDTAPYAEAPGCTLQIISRQTMQAECAKPTELTRRELFYPGWQATVNGERVLITPASRIFQKVFLPRGHAVIHFSYAPTGTHIACGVALSAMLLWLGCGLLAKLRAG